MASKMATNVAGILETGVDLGGQRFGHCDDGGGDVAEKRIDRGTGGGIRRMTWDRQDKCGVSLPS